MRSQTARTWSRRASAKRPSGPAERSTVLGIFQTVMKTVRLDVRQWMIFAAVALSIVVAAEIRKAALRRAAAMPVSR